LSQPTPDERKYDTEKLIQLARRVRDAGVHPQSVTADLPEHVLTLSLPVSMPLVTELTQEAWGFDLNMPVNAFVFADVTAQDWAEKGAGSLLTVSRRPLSLLSVRFQIDRVCTALRFEYLIVFFVFGLLQVAAGAGTQFSDSACSILLAAENGAVKVDVTDEKQPTHALEVAISTRNIKVVRRLIRAGIKWAKTTQPLVNLCVQVWCFCVEYSVSLTSHLFRRSLIFSIVNRRRCNSVWLPNIPRLRMTPAGWSDSMPCSPRPRRRSLWPLPLVRCRRLHCAWTLCYVTAAAPGSPSSLPRVWST
jgi:hypothetical protein